MALSQSPLSLGLPSSKQVLKAHLLNEWMLLHLSRFTLDSAAFRQEPCHKHSIDWGIPREDGGSWAPLILGNNHPQTQELWARPHCSLCPFYPPPRPTQGPWRTSGPDSRLPWSLRWPAARPRQRETCQIYLPKGANLFLTELRGIYFLPLMHKSPGARDLKTITAIK